MTGKKEKQPLKRHPALQDLSRDHHHALLFCWELKQGLTKKVNPERIMTFARHFYKKHLEDHFAEEESLLFPLLGMEHPQVKRACEQHRHLQGLFFTEPDLLEAASGIAEALKAHVRFEERELFGEIEKEAGEEALIIVNQKLHPRPARRSMDDWKDPFW